MPNLTTQQASAVAQNFLKLAQAIGDYRFGHWNDISETDNKALADYQWSILNAGEDILALSTSLLMADAEQSIDKLTGITENISETIGQLKKIQKVIDTATAIVTLSAAIIAKDPGAILNSLNGLINVWDNED
jgi:hypothetical protein